MNWPAHADYQDAIQNPEICFAEPTLKASTVKCDMLGLPRVMSGNFASVYEVSTGPDRWAIRCFVRQVMGQQGRYARLSQHLANVSLPYLVDFDYILKGILVRGDWYPIVKMRWVEGSPLNVYVDEHHADPAVMKRLTEGWRLLVNQLRENKIAHGDFQHGNVMVTPNGELRLVDYDGMYCPAFGRGRSPELGHANFQHPRRNADFYEEGLDNFSALVIHTTFRALATEPALWNEFYSGDNLIFSSDDFRNIHGSKLLKRLKAHQDPHVQQMATLLQHCCLSPIEQVPWFEEAVAAVESGTLPQLTAPLAPIPDAPAGVTEIWWDKTEDKPTPQVSREAPALSRPAPNEPVKTTRPAEPVRTTRPAELSRPAQPALAPAAQSPADTPKTTRPAEPLKTTRPAEPAVAGTRSAWDNAPIAPLSQSTSFSTVSTTRSRIPTSQPAPQPVAAPKSNTLVFALIGVVAVLAIVVVALLLKNKSAATAAQNLTQPAPLAATPPEEPQVASTSPPPEPAPASSSSPTITAAPNARLLGTLIEHRKGVEAVAFSPDGKWLASAGADRTVVVWNTASRQPERTMEGLSESADSLLFLTDSKSLVTVTLDNVVKIWDASSGAAKQSFPNQGDNLWPDVLSPSGHLLASGTKDRKTVRLLDFPSASGSRALKDHATWVIAVSFSGDGKLVATACADFSVRIWDLATMTVKKVIQVPNPGNANTLGIALSQTGRWLVTARDGKVARLWNVESGQLAHTLSAHDEDVRAFAFSFDEKVLLTGSSDKTARLWEIKTGKLLETLSGHEDAVVAVALSAGRDKAATASADKTVKLWDLSNVSAL
jgi:WD40 repeat protein